MGEILKKGAGREAAERLGREKRGDQRLHRGGEEMGLYLNNATVAELTRAWTPIVLEGEKDGQ